LRIAAPVTSNLIAVVFVLWHLLAGAAGVLLTARRDGTRELGIALLVGSLFAFGSFLAQFWSLAVDREREVLGTVSREDDVERMRRIVDEHGAIDRALASGASG
jgi:hypothetical protein